jgi:hypothetical protein
MDRAMLWNHLAQAERHVAEGEHHIVLHRALMDELERDGHETSGRETCCASLRKRRHCISRTGSGRAPSSRAQGGDVDAADPSDDVQG